MSRSSIRSLDPVFCENGVKFSLFVAREVKNLNQLWSALCSCRRRRRRQQKLPQRGRLSRTAQWTNQAMFFESFLVSFNSIFGIPFKSEICFLALKSIRAFKSKFSGHYYQVTLAWGLEQCLTWLTSLSSVGSNPGSARIFFCFTFLRWLEWWVLRRRSVDPSHGLTNIFLSNLFLWYPRVSIHNLIVSQSYSKVSDLVSGDKRILVLLAVLVGLAILLIRAGIELNPGPGTDYPDFRVISQNCRGLTDCRKTCRLVKKLSASNAGHSPAIACLQETHCINRFALDNLFKGTYVVDDGERNQKGVSILIP